MDALITTIGATAVLLIGGLLVKYIADVLDEIATALIKVAAFGLIATAFVGIAWVLFT